MDCSMRVWFETAGKLCVDALPIPHLFCVLANSSRFVICCDAVDMNNFYIEVIEFLLEYL